MAKGKTLIVVESPNKCASIKKYVSEIGNFTVMASVGHIRDLKKDASGIEILNGFKPNFVNSPDKTDVIKSLKEAYKQCDDCIIMTDGDNEGSAIGFHICEVLGIDPKKVKRSIALEITKKAVTEAIQNPGKLDMNVVDAAICRRILDRIVGFKISPILWQKIKMGLSAGRVQSPGLRLVCSKWKENQSFIAEPDFKVIAMFEVKDKKNKIHTFKAVLNKKFKTKIEAEKFLQNCIDKSFYVKSIEKKPGKKSAPAPFTTSVLQMECSRKFGMSPQRTLDVSQSLFASGKISYHRSDSVTLSEDALNSAELQVKEKFGNNYSNKKQFTAKNKASVQGAHEAIRPTNFNDVTIVGSDDEQKVYTLIYNRTLASQMADAKYDNTIIIIEAKNISESFVAKGQVMTFDGFLKLYAESVDDKENENDEDDNKSLPEMESNQVLKYEKITAGQIFTRPPALYTEASLIKKLEELSIGRPSTFASIVSVIQKREYCIKQDIPAKKRNIITLTLKEKNIDEESRSENYAGDKNKLVPTEIGILVNDYLSENFQDIVSYDFTARMEANLDKISEGKLHWQKMLEDFYIPFSKTIDKAKGDTTKIGVRELGIHNKLPIYAKLGKFGPMVQLGESIKQEKGKKKDEKVKSDVKFAKIPEGMSIDTITLNQALELLKWPILLGEYKKNPVTVAVGKFGPYVKTADKFYSISIAPDKITLEEAIEVIKLKEAGGGGSSTLKEFGDIKVLNGKFGAYISYKKKNTKIPAQYTPENLTKEECMEILGEAKEKKPFKKFVKKKK